MIITHEQVQSLQCYISAVLYIYCIITVLVYKSYNRIWGIICTCSYIHLCISFLAVVGSNTHSINQDKSVVPAGQLANVYAESKEFFTIKQHLDQKLEVALGEPLRKTAHYATSFFWQVISYSYDINIYMQYIHLRFIYMHMCGCYETCVHTTKCVCVLCVCVCVRACVRACVCVCVTKHVCMSWDTCAHCNMHNANAHDHKHT